MHVTEIRVTNFKAFSGEHTLPLTEDGPARNVYLVGALNGAGKTSLVQALLLSLYGAGAAGMPGLFAAGRDHRRRYEQWLAHAWNNSARTRHEEVVRVGCQIDGELRLEISRSYWFGVDARLEDEELRVTVSETNGERQVLSGDDAQEHVLAIIPRNIADLTFFDGENVSSIDRPNAGPWIVDALDRLLNLEPIKRLQGDLAKLARERRAQLADASQVRAADALQRQLDELELKDVDANKAISDVRERLLAARTELTVLDDQVASHLSGGRAVSVAQVESEAAGLDQRRKTLQDRIGRQTAEWAYLEPISDLVRALEDASTRASDGLRGQQRAKEASDVAHSLIHAVMQDPEMLKALPADTVPLINERLYFHAPKAVDDDSVSMPDWTRAFSQDELEDMRLAARSFLGRDRTEAEALYADILQLEARRDQLTAIRANLNASSGLEAVLRRRDELTELSSSWQTELTALETSSSEDRKKLSSLRSNLSRLDRRLTDSQEAQDWLKAASNLGDALDSYVRTLRAQALSSLSDGVLKRLRPLLRKQRLVTSVSIDSETYEVTLRDASGAAVRLPSAGEQQLAAIAFAAAMLDLAVSPLPMIIDTPLARLDGLHRRNLARHLLPNLGRQVVVLSTDEEIGPDLMSELDGALAATYLIEHDDASSTSTIVENAYLTFEDASATVRGGA